MHNQLIATALNQGYCPTGLYPTPDKSADNYFIELILQGLDRLEEQLTRKGSNLYDFYLGIKEPVNYSPFSNEDGIRFAETLLKIIIYQNYQAGASYTNPIPNQQLIVSATMTYGESILASIFSDLYNFNELPEEVKANYLASARSINEELSRVAGFLQLSTDEKIAAVARQTQRQNNTANDLLSKSDYVLSSINEEKISLTEALIIPEENTMSDDFDKNFFSDIKNINEQNEMAMQVEAEKHAEGLRLKERRLKSLKVDSKDEAGQAHVSNDKPIFTTPIFNTFKEEETSDNNEDIIEICREAAIESDEDLYTTDNTQNQEIKENDMYSMNSKSGLKPQAQNIPNEQRLTGSGFKQDVCRVENVQIFDARTNAPILMVDGRTPFMLPKDIAPSVPVEHLVSNGRYEFYQDGVPILIFWEHNQEKVWSPDVDPMHRSPMVGSGELQSHSIYNQATPEPDTGSSMETDDILDAALLVKRQLRNKNRKERAPKQEIPHPHRSFPASPMPTAKAELGNIRIKTYQGETYSCIRRSETEIRALVGFPEKLGILGSDHEVLLALDDDLKPMEFLISKDKVMNYEDHVGQFNQLIELGAFEGTPADLAVADAIEDVSPFAVTLNTDTKINADNAIDLIHLLRVRAMSAPDLDLVNVELLKYLRLPAIDEEVVKEIETLISSTLTDDVKIEYDPLTQIFAIISKTDNPTFDFLDGILTDWIVTALRYRLKVTTPELAISSALEHADDIAAFSKKNNIIQELVALFAKEVGDVFNFESVTETVGEIENTTTAQVINTLASYSDTEDSIPLGRIAYETHVSFYRHIAGIFKTLEKVKEENRFVLVATEAGELLKIMAVGNNCPFFYCVEKL